MCGGTLHSLSCTILLRTTACKFCVVHFEENFTLGDVGPTPSDSLYRCADRCPGGSAYQSARPGKLLLSLSCKMLNAMCSHVKNGALSFSLCRSASWTRLMLACDRILMSHFVISVSSVPNSIEEELQTELELSVMYVPSSISDCRPAIVRG